MEIRCKSYLPLSLNISNYKVIKPNIKYKLVHPWGTYIKGGKSMFCGESTMLNPLIKEKEAAVNQMGEYLHYLALSALNARLKLDHQNIPVGGLSGKRLHWLRSAVFHCT